MLKSPLKEQLFFKFCFFVVLMVLNAVSGPSLPTELRLDMPRSVSDPQTCCWSSAQITGTASSCSGRDNQEQEGRMREENTSAHLILKSAASQKHCLAAGLSGTSHTSSFLCKAQLNSFFTFIQTLPSLPVHQFWILVYPFHPHHSYYSAALLGLAPVAFPWVWVSKCCNQ